MISVIIPTYNRRKTLKRAINSVLAQTWQDIEIIVVDDASTDDTYSYMVSEYGERENLIYIRNEKNVGQSAARNIGVDYARGEYVAFLDSDDEWAETKLEKQINTMQNANAEVCYSAFVWKWKNGMTGKWPPDHWGRMEGNVFHFLLLHPLAGMITLLMRRDLFMETGGFDERLRAMEDYEFMIRVSQTAPFAYVDEILAVAYVSEISVGKNNNEKIFTQCYIMNKYSEELKKIGKKEEKFQAVLKNAEEWGEMKVFLALMWNSEDEDYVQYLKDMHQQLSDK